MSVVLPPLHGSDERVEQFVVSNRELQADFTVAPLALPQLTIGTATNCDSLPVIFAGRFPAVIRELTALLISILCTGQQASPVLVAITSPTLTVQAHPLVILQLAL
jgi:hypothetical protein